jgi:hypothetical protein
LKGKLFSISIIIVTFCLFGISSAIAAALPLSKHGEGAILNNVSDYDWWYGCSPTSAGMMMAYYDINGYDGLLYDNLVPGGQAELSTFPSTPGQWDYLAQSAIASPEHVSDFYVSGYDRSGDDVRGTRHDFDSLADFMGTSQDPAGNTNGWTTSGFTTMAHRFMCQTSMQREIIITKVTGCSACGSISTKRVMVMKHPIAIFLVSIRIHTSARMGLALAIMWCGSS